MYTVYIIKSSKIGKYYVGSTNNLRRRLFEHANNKTKSLKNKGPFSVIYSEKFNTLIEARRRELKIKSYKGGNAFKELINVAHR